MMLALLASVKAGCTDTSDNPPICETKSKKIGTTTKYVQCVVGTSNNMDYKPINGDTRFAGADFRHQCLVNAGKSCQSRDNTLQEDDPDLSCCSCYLYAYHCAGKGHGVPITWKSKNYVVDHQPIIDSNGRHALVMPTAPCSGIEWWNNDDYSSAGSKPVTGMHCPGEDVWEVAARVIANNPPDGADNHYGMAINPISRRGEHQMHIHIAKVSSSLLASLSYAHNALKLPTFNLDCGLDPNPPLHTPSTRLLKCRIFFGPMPSGPENPKVTIYPSLKSVAEAKPFENTYGGKAGTTAQPNPPPPTATDTIRRTSLLVIEVPPHKSDSAKTRNWAVITNDVGPAECFFVPNGDKSLEDACKDP